MAWVIGLVSKDDIKSLHKEGWEDVDPPESMLSEDEIRGDDDYGTRAFFVDEDVIDILRISKRIEV